MQQAKVQFITGALDIENDADWDNYLSTLEAMGLEHYMEVVEKVNFGG